MLNSFSVVATHEVKEEVAVLIFALRKFHSQPVYLLCDTITAEFVDNFGFSDVVVDIDADDWDLVAAAQEYKSVRVENDYHRIDCIAKKMDALERAIFMFGNTLFLDSDIVPLHRLDLDITSPVMVSPHLHGTDRRVNMRKYGAYNAGYVYCQEPELPDVWREIYRERSSFYEQQGMIYFHEEFRVGKFPASHNVGFWRFEIKDGNIVAPPPQHIVSFHAHLFEKTFAHADPGLQRVYGQMRHRVLHGLAHMHSDIFKFVQVVDELT